MKALAYFLADNIIEFSQLLLSICSCRFWFAAGCLFRWCQSTCNVLWEFCGHCTVPRYSPISCLISAVMSQNSKTPHLTCWHWCFALNRVSLALHSTNKMLLMVSFLFPVPLFPGTEQVLLIMFTLTYTKVFRVKMLKRTNWFKTNYILTYCYHDVEKTSSVSFPRYGYPEENVMLMLRGCSAFRGKCGFAAWRHQTSLSLSPLSFQVYRFIFATVLTRK